MRFVFFVSILVLVISAAGCSAKKIIAKDCEKAGNADLFVCEKL